MRVKRVLNIIIILMLLLPVINLEAFKVLAADGNTDLAYGTMPVPKAGGGSTNIGMVWNKDTVKMGSSTSVRWTTIGWYYRFTHMGKTFKGVLRYDKDLHYYNERIDYATQTISYENRLPFMDGMRFVDDVTNSRYGAMAQWNKTVIDNLYYEYPNVADRKIIFDFFNTGSGRTMYFNTIISTISPGSTTPNAWMGTGSKFGSGTYPSTSGWWGDMNKVALTAAEAKALAPWSDRTKAIMDDLYNMPIVIQPLNIPPQTCEIYFKDPNNTKAGKISTVSVKEGDKVYVDAYLHSPQKMWTDYKINKDVKATWKTFKQAVVTVDDGVITGVAKSDTAYSVGITYSNSADPDAMTCTGLLKVTVTGDEDGPTDGSSTGDTNTSKGGYLNKPVFRVGIMRDPGFYVNPDPVEKGKDKAAEAWSYRFPKNTDSIYFTPAGYNSWYPDFYIGSYEPSSRTLLKYDGVSTKAKVKNLNNYTSDSIPANPMKTALNSYSLYGTKNYGELANGEWMLIADSIPIANAQAQWDYILRDLPGAGYGVDSRMDAVVGAKAYAFGQSVLTNDEVEDIYRGHLALLMNTWKLVPVDQRIPWENAIEDLIVMKQQGEGEMPSTIVVDTAMTFKMDELPKTLIIPTVDYFQFYGGIGTAWDIHNLKKGDLGAAEGKTYDMLKQLLINDIAAEPNVSRISSNPNLDNVYSTAADAIAYPYKRLTSSSNDPRWADSVNPDGIMDLLYFMKYDLMGFSAGTYTLPINAPNLNVEFAVSPERSIVDYQQEVIGENVRLTFTHNGADAEAINKWRNILSQNGNETVKLTITPNRTASPTASQPASYSSIDGDYTLGVSMTKSDFLSFLQGGKTIEIIDDTSTEPIAKGTIKKFTYTPKFEVDFKNQGIDNTATKILLPDDATFVRPPAALMMYTSEPSSYAEFKEGSPDNESFEAMAGVPSNKTLYLGVGGSEFIVDVELEFKEDVDSVWRTYRSYYEGTASEFKSGDNAGTASLGGQTVDLHNGGTYTKTWSGSIPNNGTAQTTNGSGTVSATSTAVPDRSAYNADKAAAQAYAASVNATTISHTAASDGVTRSYNSWGAAITTDSPSDPQSVTKSNTCTHTETGTNADGTTYTYTVNDPCTVTADPAPAGSYTITVTYKVPAHVVDGPECENDMPGVEDTWKQRINFDHLQISRVDVYKIHEGKITQVDDLFGAGNGEVTATIKQGEPSLFYNIAEQNAGGDIVAAQSSKHGRIRYSLEGDQHDEVEWYEGVRSNTSDGMGANGSSFAPQGGGHSNAWGKGILYNNTGYTDEYDYHRNKGGTNTAYSNTADSKDVATPEWARFNERRKMTNTATIISDMLILQTSSGDQAVLYFDKDSVEVESQKQFPDLNATAEEMWDNNPNSAANWDKKEIHVGSYNGNFASTGNGPSNNQKYWGFDQVSRSFLASNSNTVTTAFDSNGAGVDGRRFRSAKPSRMYIWEDTDIVPTTRNGAYTSGGAKVFYEQQLAYSSPNAYSDYVGFTLQPNYYTPQNQVDFSNRKGLTFGAPYSDVHSKVNDVVIHTPVSSQEAMIVSLPDYMDQRTSLPPGGAAAMIDRQNNLSGGTGASGPPQFKDQIDKKITTTTTTTEQIDTTIDKNEIKQVLVSNGGQDTKTYAYNGAQQQFVSPVTGTYTLEVWGSQGGNSGGLGGYAKGTINLTKDEVLNVNVGGTNGYNGGGGGYATGGGGTDIRKGGTALSNRIIVAGGGGGQSFAGTAGYGGGDVGGTGTGRGTAYAGTQTGGYQLGQGATGSNSSSACTGGGGGGYYGGGKGLDDRPDYYDCDDGSGGGGSGYIGGVSNGQNIAGNVTMPHPSGGTQIGHSGNGIAKISYDLPPVYEEEIITTSETTSESKDPVVGSRVSETSTGEVTGYGGYTWLDLFGPNWSKYLKTSNSTYSEIKNSVIGPTTETITFPVDIAYTGNAQVWEVPVTDTYTFELWGAESGATKGSYAKGEIALTKGQKLNLYVGGSTWNSATTDIRLGGNALTDRLAYAGGSTSYSDGLTEGATLSGNQSMPKPAGGNETGHTGNGVIRIHLGTYEPNIAPVSPNIGVSRIFNNTSSGKTGANIDNSSGALGSPPTFPSQAGIYHWTVPETGTYKIEAFGAQGGANNTDSGIRYGGQGAKVKGEVQLTAGTVLKILVGQRGGDGDFDRTSHNSAGGGGGTFVALSDNTPLIIAGGGGGMDNSSAHAWTGPNGVTSECGGGSSPSGYGTGGCNGQEGTMPDSSGGQPGAGFYSDANAPTNGYVNGLAYSFVNGGIGGTSTNPSYGTSYQGPPNGGFGGGGATHGSSGGGAGGGGYSGGAGANHQLGGGGGSYIASNVNSVATSDGKYNGTTTFNGQSITNLSSYEPDHGQVTITLLSGSGSGSTGGTTTGAATDFSYTGNVQTFTAPADGTYALEVWGAQGGGSYSNGSFQTGAGKGGYSKGEITLTKGEVVNIYVGGKGGDAISGGGGGSAGWNGGGTGGSDYDGDNDDNAGGGGGATDIRKGGTALSNRVIVAGGSGGNGFYADSSFGGGTSGGVGSSGTIPGTQTSGYALGLGQNGLNSNQGSLGGGSSGGGGGGYYGGTADSSRYGAGAGGSGYIGGVTNGQTIAGNASMPNPSGGTMMGSSGNGFARITAINIVPPEPEVTSTITVKTTKNTKMDSNIEETRVYVDTVAVQADLATFPDFMPDGEFNPVKAAYGAPQPAKPSPIATPTITPTGDALNLATFINIDYPFQVYYPNMGDFAQQPTLDGISTLTTTRGKGYINGMDTTEYTAGKRVKFQFNVIYNGKLYLPNTWIQLPVDQDYYDFYAVLANRELSAAEVEFDAVPINGSPSGAPVNDNPSEVTNKDRFADYSSFHGSYKLSYIDVVGRIGNFVVSDTDDFRLSNLFKKPDGSGEWLVEGLVAKADPYQQNNYYGDLIDIRGIPVSRSTTNKVWTPNTGLYLRPGTENTEGNAFADAIGEGVYGPYATVQKGTYKITVKGSGLINGSPIVLYNYGANSLIPQKVSKSYTMATYYVDVPLDIANIEWTYQQDLAGEMEIVSIEMQAMNSTQGTGLNTYGAEPWKEAQSLQFPVNPNDNTVDALKEQFIKSGYDVLADITTTGSYQSGLVQVLPYYYKLDLETGLVTPLDVYVPDGDKYSPVNRYKGADGGSLPSDLYPYDLVIDWEKESARRNFSVEEAKITKRVSDEKGEFVYGNVLINGSTEEGVTEVIDVTTPKGTYINIGNAQRVVAQKETRTFSGTSKTNGVEMNLGGKIPEVDWNWAAQRWHLKLGIPSSSIFVEAGQQPTLANIEEIQEGNGVVLMTADIISVGSLYTLRWEQPGLTSFDVTKNGVTRAFDISSAGIPPVIGLYDLKETAEVDIDVRGTH